jgi:transcription antitermination factor NusG
MSDWYVAKAHRPHPGGLDAAWAEIKAHGLECHVPWMEPLVLPQKPGQKQRDPIRRAAFGRYIFVSLSPQDDIGWFSRPEHLGGPRTIDGLVTMAGSPQPVRGSFVNDLIVHGPMSAIVMQFATLAPGTMLRVKYGPYEGNSGIFDRHDNGGRVSLLMDLLGGSTRISMARDQVEAA